MNLLVAESDEPLARFLMKGFVQEFHSVAIARNAEEALDYLCATEFDVVVLGLDGTDGDRVLKLRNAKDTPLIVVTKPNRPEDRVQLLDSGADDCLAKPIFFEELSARVRAVSRRGRKIVEQSFLHVADLTLDRVQRIVARAEKRIDLSAKEFALLEYLMRNAGRRVTRTMIMENVWSLGFDTGTNVVDVYINYLRKKVDKGHRRQLITTIRGVGYSISDPGFNSENLEANKSTNCDVTHSEASKVALNLGLD